MRGTAAPGLVTVTAVGVREGRLGSKGLERVHGNDGNDV